MAGASLAGAAASRSAHAFTLCRSSIARRSTGVLSFFKQLHACWWLQAVAAAGGEKKTFWLSFVPFFRAIISAMEREILKRRRGKGVLSSMRLRLFAMELSLSFKFGLKLISRAKQKQNQPNN
jgi:hypothetical protein